MPFDANTFLDSSISGSTSTEKILIEAAEYEAEVVDMKVSTGFSDKSGENWARLDLIFEVDDDVQRNRTGKSRLLYTYGIMLELDDNSPDGLAHGRGRNVKFGKAREALGLNSGDLNPREILHHRAKIQIKHQIWENEPTEKVAAMRKV